MNKIYVDEPNNSTLHAPLLEVQDIVCSYGSSRSLPFFHRKTMPIVDKVNFNIGRRDTFGLVGESGSGKTTVMRAIAGLLVPTAGRILFEKQDITCRIDSRPKKLHHEIQIVFQNPDASLNPKHQISYIIGRPLAYYFHYDKKNQREKTVDLLNAVHLDSSYMDRMPFQLSGGERQRVAIARALAAEPKILLCDEIVSALDVSVQASILSLLQEIQQKREITYIFVAHNLAVVRWLVNRVGVLYRGQMVEIGSPEEVFSPPFHPYTEMLLLSVPEPNPNRPILYRRLDELQKYTSEDFLGCPFSSRCFYSDKMMCKKEPPNWQEINPSHQIRCHIPVDILLQSQKQL